MNTNERKPLLSHEQILDMAKKSHLEPRHYYAGELPFAISIRDYYESLITTGKLRVVEEVELDEDGNCPKCGNFMWMPDDVSGHSMIDNYCGNCGTKIKQ